MEKVRQRETFLGHIHEEDTVHCHTFSVFFLSYFYSTHLQSILKSRLVFRLWIFHLKQVCINIYTYSSSWRIVFGFTAKLRLTWGVTNTNTIMLTSVQFNFNYFFSVVFSNRAHSVCGRLLHMQTNICTIYSRSIISLGPKCHKQDNWLQPSQKRCVIFIFSVKIVLFIRVRNWIVEKSI